MENKKKLREFGLTSFSLRNTNTIFLFTLIITIFGVLSYITLPKELFPEVKFPSIFVQTVYPGYNPTDIEDLITRPLEKQLKTVKGIKEIKSSSVQDFSVITVEFNFGIDNSKALQDVKDAVDKAKSDLPDDLKTDPTVTDIDVSEFPIINVNLSGQYSVSELRYFAEYLQDKIEAHHEISKVNITGLNDREIQINVNPPKMEALKVSFNDIKNAIAYENVTMSGGQILQGNTRRSINIVGTYISTEEIENTIVKAEQGDVVYLRDVASVIDTYAEPKSFARLNEQTVVSLQVIKKSGENLLNAVDNVFADIKTAQKAKILPQDISINYTNDQSKNIKSQLNNLLNSMIMGFAFVVIILYLFLGLRNALLVGLSIPISMLVSFAVIGVMGYTINMIILFSLILALGMLVDNAIVAVENIYRFISQGYSVKDAAKYATGEIAIPIIASTATTLAAFFPLAFWDSMVGQFMKLLPITLIIVLTSSLFVALVIVPVFARTFIHENITHEELNKKHNYTAIAIMLAIALPAYLFKAYFVANLLVLFAIIGLINVLFLFKLSHWFKDIFLEKLENAYLHTIEFTLSGRKPLWIFIGMFFLLVGSMMFYAWRSPKIDFFPENQPQYINIAVTFPEGTDIGATNRFMLSMEQDVKKLVNPYEKYLESLQLTVGKGSNAEREMAIGDTPNKGILSVRFIDEEFRTDINTSEIMKQLNDSLINKYPGAEVIIQKNANGPPTGSPINLEIKGDDLTTLLAIADSVETLIETNNVQGIQNLKLDVAMDKPELNVQINRDMAIRFGLSTIQIASAIRTALFGEEAAKYKVGEEQYPINVRYDDNYRYDLDALINQKITFRNKRGQLVQVPISSVASINYITSYGSVKRIDLERVVTFSSDAVEGFNANEINKEIKEIIEAYKLPENYVVQFTGEQQEQQESMAFMMRAMLIAVSLILIILVIQFDSIIKPLIIGASVLFSTIGVFGALATFNMDFVIMMTGIGIISLAGVVVNNAIVLLDYIDYLKSERKKEMGIMPEGNLPLDEIRNLIIIAGKTRLRPVLLTAITTILGLVPMAIGLNINFATMLSAFDPHLYIGGDNASFWGPMAWTVIFGLSFATILTLLVVPMMYFLFNKVKLKFVKN